VHFLGRLGTYKYYNMDQVVAQALALYGKLAGVRRRELPLVERGRPSEVRQFTSTETRSA
jgi:UDP-galactopyranose mutase